MKFFNKKTPYIIIIAIVVVLLVTSIAFAVDNDEISGVVGNIGEWINNLRESKKEAKGLTDKEDIETSFYEYCYNKAESEEQKKALDLLVEDRSFGFGEWKREALIIIGEIPKDTKRITIEDVKDIAHLVL